MYRKKFSMPSSQYPPLPQEQNDGTSAGGEEKLQSFGHIPSTVDVERGSPHDSEGQGTLENFIRNARKNSGNYSCNENLSRHIYETNENVYRQSQSSRKCGKNATRYTDENSKLNERGSVCKTVEVKVNGLGDNGFTGNIAVTVEEMEKLMQCSAEEAKDHINKNFGSVEGLCKKLGSNPTTGK